MSEEEQRYIPLPVRRALRQQAYFGCAKCGNPILEYHHIIPWAERKHNDPDHMVALCPTHHQQFGKLSSEESYEVKANPKNKLVGKIYGELGTDREVTSFLVGSNTYIDTPIIFSYFERPIIRYTIENRQTLLDVYIPKQDMWPDVYIKRNDMIVNSDGMWDIEFRTNYLKIQKRAGANFFEIDLRGEDALINGAFGINGEEFKFSPKSTNIGGLSIFDSVIVRCGGGIGRGDGKHRLLWPNFAMAEPKALYAKI